MKKILRFALSLAATSAAAFLVTGLLLSNPVGATPQPVLPEATNTCPMSGSAVATYGNCYTNCVVTHSVLGRSAAPNCGGCSGLVVVSITCGGGPMGGGITSYSTHAMSAKCAGTGTKVLPCPDGSPFARILISCYTCDN